MPERHSRLGSTEATAYARTFERPSGSVPAQARTVRNNAEAQRLYRAGIRSPLGPGSALLIWEQPRNGIPWKPYVYRGLGYDQLEGPEAEAP